MTILTTWQISVSMCISSGENITWLYKQSSKPDFDFIVVDESTSFKSWSSNRFKCLKRMIDTGTKVTLLTGTPAPNSYLELWSQMYLLDRGEALGRNITAYKKRFFEVDYMGYNFTLRGNAKSIIDEKIKPYCVVVENYEGLSDIKQIQHDVQLSERAKQDYKAFVREKVLELGDEEITAVHAGALTSKIQQYAQGAIYDETKKWYSVHDEKLHELESILEQVEGENVLVAYGYKHDKERLLKRFKHARDISEKGVIDEWKKGKVPLLLAHPASAGHGLNLQDGGHRIVWFCLTWSNELKAQFDARLYRQGQNETVFVHSIVAKDTIDEQILDALEGKDVTQRSFIESVRGELKR